MKNQARLLENFVGKFRSLDECTNNGEPIVIKQATSASELDRVYSVLPARFPQLYEELLLNYRWQPAFVGAIRLLENPPGQELNECLSVLSHDKFLSATCWQNKFVQFAFFGDTYDPVCFDCNVGRRQNFNVVILDHEEILCRARISKKQTIASSFEQLVLDLNS
jgi:hypothetical protein